MLGEFRRTALAIRSYRDGVPEDKSEKMLKIHKVAENMTQAVRDISGSRKQI